MHAYPLYCDVARGFLDPELVPFACALTAELAGTGRAPLMHEFGICTAPPGSAGVTITDDFLGRPRAQYLASEEEGARITQQVLERLAATGAAGAYAWCYADYDPTLFDRAPFDTAVRERSFGLVRADGSEKPACAGHPRVRRAPRARRGPLRRRPQDPRRERRRLLRRAGAPFPPPLRAMAHGRARANSWAGGPIVESRVTRLRSREGGCRRRQRVQAAEGAPRGEVAAHAVHAAARRRRRRADEEARVRRGVRDRGARTGRVKNCAQVGDAAGDRAADVVRVLALEIRRCA